MFIKDKSLGNIKFMIKDYLDGMTDVKYVTQSPWSIERHMKNYKMKHVHTKCLTVPLVI